MAIRLKGRAVKADSVVDGDAEEDGAEEAGEKEDGDEPEGGELEGPGKDQLEDARADCGAVIEPMIETEALVESGASSDLVVTIRE